ncbi:hypothetical protein ABES58_05370 [Paenibacillus lautus]|uniref:hypothetical protein n=1 Tax=Paenibacillus lautus TaxID=1401 RepID=UPI003D2AD54B
MLVTGAKRADEIQNILLKLAVGGISRGLANGLTVHNAKLTQRKITDKLYMKNIRAQISEHYKSKQ